MRPYEERASCLALHLGASFLERSHRLSLLPPPLPSLAVVCPVSSPSSFLPIHTMTEYDYSPEAYDRYLATQHRISNWRDDVNRYKFQPPPLPLLPTAKPVPAPIKPLPKRSQSQGYVTVYPAAQPPPTRPTPSRSYTTAPNAVYPPTSRHTHAHTASQPHLVHQAQQDTHQHTRTRTHSRSQSTSVSVPVHVPIQAPVPRQAYASSSRIPVPPKLAPVPPSSRVPQPRRSRTYSYAAAPQTAAQPSMVNVIYYDPRNPPVMPKAGPTFIPVPSRGSRTDARVRYYPFCI